MNQLAASNDLERESLLVQFMAEIEREGTPLIEAATDPAFRIVTFIYRGPAADRVYLQANKLTDAFTPAEGKLTPISGTDIATLSIRMPVDWICSYFFLTPTEPFDGDGGRLSVREVLQQRDAVQADPLNPNAMPHKLLPRSGQSVVALAEAPETPPAQSSNRWRESSTGIRLPMSGAEVQAVVHSHPNADAHSPAVFLCDGEVWLHQRILAEALEYRIASGACPPLHLVYIPSGGLQARQRDYTAEADAQAELLELAGAVLRVAQPGWDAHWIVAGQSLGGLFALFAATRFPQQVAGAVAQSPSLWWPSEGPLNPGPGQWFRELGAAGDCAPCVVQGGRTEWILIEPVLHAREFLRGLDRLVETPSDIVTGGHDEAWWRRTLPEAIEAIAHS